VEVLDLIRDGGEVAAIRELLAFTIYPEATADLEAAQRAIVLCVCGKWEQRLVVAGREASAAAHVGALNLEWFVARLLRAWLN
jgi:hypothetical protein